ncbi:class I SAM-dependent methyltransferase [Candidatus Woesearchaeota archaeon]|nr:class I SAM-dependent methyltransferase [Candidatus Woesearchaeota archaeon]
MPHYFSEKQDSELEVKKVQVIIRNKEYEFFTGNGVFSSRKIDNGTKVLANYMQVKEKDRVLDFGCGIGVIGRIAKEFTKNEVVFVDVNERALELVRMNLKGFQKFVIKKSDVFNSLQDEKFDVILLNPPQSAGRKLCLRMIAESLEHLNPSGSLQIVARHNIGGSYFEKYMKEVFGNVSVLARKGGYRVYKSEKN